MGGEGVFATKFHSRGSILCHYGGLLLNARHVQEDYATHATKFLYHFQIGEHHLFFNHYSYSTKTFGCMMNHSRIHPNTFAKVHQNQFGAPVILHFAKRNILENEELVHAYGPFYQNTPDCTALCKLCHPGKLDLVDVVVPLYFTFVHDFLEPAFIIVPLAPKIIYILCNFIFFRTHPQEGWHIWSTWSTFFQWFWFWTDSEEERFVFGRLWAGYRAG